MWSMARAGLCSLVRQAAPGSAEQRRAALGSAGQRQTALGSAGACAGACARGMRPGHAPGACARGMRPGSAGHSRAVPRQVALDSARQRRARGGGVLFWQRLPPLQGRLGVAQFPKRGRPRTSRSGRPRMARSGRPRMARSGRPRMARSNKRGSPHGGAPRGSPHGGAVTGEPPQGSPHRSGRPRMARSGRPRMARRQGETHRVTPQENPKMLASGRLLADGPWSSGCRRPVVVCGRPEVVCGWPAVVCG